MANQKILVPFDFSSHSERALNVASDLARELKSEIHLVFVHDGERSAMVKKHFNSILNQQRAFRRRVP